MEQTQSNSNCSHKTVFHSLVAINPLCVCTSKMAGETTRYLVWWSDSMCSLVHQLCELTRCDGPHTPVCLSIRHFCNSKCSWVLHPLRSFQASPHPSGFLNYQWPSLCSNLRIIKSIDICSENSIATSARHASTGFSLLPLEMSRNTICTLPWLFVDRWGGTDFKNPSPSASL